MISRIQVVKVMLIFSLVLFPLYQVARGAEWLPMDTGFTNDFYGVWGSSGDDVYVVGTLGINLHYDGNAQGAWKLLEDISPWLSAVWGSSASDVFGVCYGGKIIHFDGSAWSTMESGTEEWLKGLWGSSSDNVFTVGENGTILRYNGEMWSKMKSMTTEHLYGVWGTAADNIFAVGAAGTILHFNGVIWSAGMDSGTTEGLRAIWGNAGSDIFAVGDKGTIIHYDGAGWSPMESNTTAWLLGVWGTSATDVYAVGGYYDGVGGWWSRDAWDGGVIMHFDGETWSEIKNDIPQRLFGIWGSSAADMYAVGAYGTILHYDDSGDDACLFKNLYGEHSRQVGHLRLLRDNQLNSTLVGSGLVKLYYACSPFMVKMVKGNETVRGSLKTLIDAVLPLMGVAAE